MINLTTVCPNCGADAQSEDIEDWVSFNTVPATCTTCATVFWTPVITDQTLVVNSTNPQVLDNSQPLLPIGTVVTVVMPGHAFHNRVGRIIAHKHQFYRVVIGNRRILIPNAGVRAYD